MYKTASYVLSISLNLNLRNSRIVFSSYCQNISSHHFQRLIYLLEQERFLRTNSRKYTSILSRAIIIFFLVTTYVHVLTPHVRTPVHVLALGSNGLIMLGTKSLLNYIA